MSDVSPVIVGVELGTLICMWNINVCFVQGQWRLTQVPGNSWLGRQIQEVIENSAELLALTIPEGTDLLVIAMPRNIQIQWLKDEIQCLIVSSLCIAIK